MSISWSKARVEAAQKALTKADDNYTRLGPTYPEQSTGRRLALARWIASAENPLTSRVAVNHIWLRHFGQGLVPTPADFGRNGRPPSHPQLLDWLAAELMARSWSMKALHRLIVNSATYRQSSAQPANDSYRRAVALDADNQLLWRFPPRRLEADEFGVQALQARGGPLQIGGRNHLQQLAMPAGERELDFPVLDAFDERDVRELWVR